VVDSTEYAETFKLIDANQDGLISAEELTRLMVALGDEITDEAAAEAVRIMDQDGDNQISLDEFAGYLAARSRD
jgi:Ca2+-binding EF-hand superfamily protein